MNDDYSIDSLIGIFERHAKEYEARCKKIRENEFETNYDDSFSLSKALLTICKAIKELERD